MACGTATLEEPRPRPEFRNRIDQLVVFYPLTKDNVREIALKYVNRVTRNLRRFDKMLTIDADALDMQGDSRRTSRVF